MVWGSPGIAMLWKRMKDRKVIRSLTIYLLIWIVLVGTFDTLAQNALLAPGRFQSVGILFLLGLSVTVVLTGRKKQPE